MEICGRPKEVWNRSETSTSSSSTSTSASTSTSSTSSTSASTAPAPAQHQHQHQHQHQRQHQHQQHQDQRQRQPEQVTNRRITTVSCDRRVRSYEKVAPSTARSQFYYSFARSTRPILRKGEHQRQRQHQHQQHQDQHQHQLEQVTNRRITTVSCDRRVRSYERVHRAGKKSSNYYSFARSTRTILRKGCISASIFRTMAAPPLIT